MLSIYSHNSTISAQEHCDLVKGWVSKRIESKRIDKSHKRNLKDDLQDILMGRPDELLMLSKKYNIIFPKKATRSKKRKRWITDPRVSYIFDYTEFRKKYGYQLAQKLNVPCCPYCNRNYTTVHETLKEKKLEKKLVFPEFDHFYPKNEHPILALSFYNLIPSCNVCNTHFKGGKDPITRKLLHPYTAVEANHFNFKFYSEDYASLIGKGLKIKIDFSYNSSTDINDAVKKSIEFFDIKAIYEKCHSSLIKDVVDKRISYCNQYLKELQVTFKLDFNQAFRMLFETDYADENLLQRPFSKLKKDIYNDVEIAKYQK